MNYIFGKNPFEPIPSFSHSKSVGNKTIPILYYFNTRKPLKIRESYVVWPCLWQAAKPTQVDSHLLLSGLTNRWQTASTINLPSSKVNVRKKEFCGGRRRPLRPLCDKIDKPLYERTTLCPIAFSLMQVRTNQTMIKRQGLHIIHCKVMGFFQKTFVWLV